MNYSTYVITLLTILLLCGGLTGSAQSIPEPVADGGIYLFLDELAGDGVIDLNRAVKPYSRLMIRKMLEEAALVAGGETYDEEAAVLAGGETYDEEAAVLTGDAMTVEVTSGPTGRATTGRAHLTTRQRRELDFWLEAYGMTTPQGKLKLVYNPATAQYRDSLFSITVAPILGITAGLTPDASADLLTGVANTRPISWKNGAKVYGNYRNWGFFAALQDNHQDPLLGSSQYLTRERGGHIKGGTDFSEMTGGISYSWEWGDIAFLKDAPVWGSGYAGTNILSGRAPSFMQIRLHLQPVHWAEMTWMHGWLTSMVIDSTRSFWVTNAYGTDYRELYRRKYIAANIFTVTPVPRLKVSLGNSVIWSDPRLTPYYLMPIFFYKSVDHGITSGIENSNSQMFLDVSSTNIRHLHLYGTLFIDEMSTKRFFTSDYNFFSWKGGFRGGNFSFMPNIWLTAECTFTYPLTFQHNVPVLTFENQGYNMGHWLRDNSRSWHFALDWRPVRTMTLRLWHEWSERSVDYQSIGGTRLGLPYLESVEWSNTATGFDASWYVTGGVQLRAEVTRRNVTGNQFWYPSHLFGNTTSFTGGVVWGF